MPQPLTCGAQVSCPLEYTVQPLYKMLRSCQACGSAPISWEGTGRVQRELSSPGFLFGLFLHPLGGLLHLSGIRWTWGAKVRPLRKKKWAFLNRVDKCIWAVETDSSYTTLQFLCFGKIALPPLHSKASRYCSIGGCCKLLHIAKACLNSMCPRDLCWGSSFDTV